MTKSRIILVRTGKPTLPMLRLVDGKLKPTRRKGMTLTLRRTALP